MSVNVVMLLVMGVLFACGVYLLLERSLTRVLLGLVLISNGVNLLLLTAGGLPGMAPLYDSAIEPGAYSDPLPQALILTAIVITFAVTAFLLAMIYRSWVIARRDEVVDDVEDRRVAEQSHFDFEEDSEIEADTTEFTSEDDDAAARAKAAVAAERRQASAEESAGTSDESRNREAR
ncbi:Na(+)/H(+) antiporter subunit C [Zafaria sp. J156]|uniref:Na(+)/H(+) antiporter subunit C n=1 Tax=Zafaria sp. J156 TaxID=3116490 RepID=UPI002E782B98|nr:Na(+)/H(+) antiporter subunit C [Zafaria sp. J156]MEE1622338.1 Na(+)/H(+) antiporter subunit C [Zafaria sp. J156]